MGWDFNQYEAQPTYFINQLLCKWSLDNRKQEVEQKKAEMKAEMKAKNKR